MRQPHQTHLSAFTEEEDSLRISGQEFNPGYAGLTLDPGDGEGIMPLLNFTLSGLNIASLARCGYLLRSPAAPPRAALGNPFLLYATCWVCIRENKNSTFKSDTVGVWYVLHIFSASPTRIPIANKNPIAHELGNNPRTHTLKC